MIYLLLSILASTGVLVIFRWLGSHNANTRHAITLSYLVAALFGFIFFDSDLEVVFANWFWFAAIEGGAFYFVFRLMAKTTQVNGIAVASIATKMSVVIPVCIGIFFLNESAGIVKILGIAAGIFAVVLSAGSFLQVKQSIWPILVFLGSGLIDASFKLFQIWGVSESQFPAFLTTVFSFAFVVGLIHHLTCKDRKIRLPSLFGATMLGLINFATVYFLLKALAQPSWESSLIYPMNNFGVVVLSTLVAVVIFREKLNPRGLVGLWMAVGSIGLLFLGTVSV
ncbi:MAG: drug/metabolite transporter (DMT)-like permease [Parasphingorhabdus sp.]|jgi:drug/metabolite transporter (DMT)-like permease